MSTLTGFTLTGFILFIIWFVVFVGFCVLAFKIDRVIESKKYGLDEEKRNYLYSDIQRKMFGILSGTITVILFVVGLFHPLLITYPAMFGTVPATRLDDGTIRELPFGAIDLIYGFNKVSRLAPELQCNSNYYFYINGTIRFELSGPPWPWAVHLKRVDGYKSYAKYWKDDDVCTEVRTVFLEEVRRQFSGSDVSLTWSSREAYDKKEEEIREHLSEALRNKFLPDGIKFQKVNF